MPRGPISAGVTGFYNPAMAAPRTRSVLLLADALEHDWLKGSTGGLRVLESLCSTGTRSRRWSSEIPENLLENVVITANDRDAGAIEWAKSYGDDSIIRWSQEDARILMHRESFQWIDIDPFGSPIPFIDSAMQSLPRVGMLEVTATDTAALCGSAQDAGKRRYGSVGLNDAYRHDDAIRILLATIAKAAARHDRIIEPILSLFDGHHLRVSVRVLKSRKKASKVGETIGWRHRDAAATLSLEKVEPCSGPLWIGPLCDAKIASRMTEEKALELCGADEGIMPEYWTSNDLELSRREIIRSVRFIADSADLMSRDHLFMPIDLLPRLAGLGGPPAMNALIESLKNAGYCAARGPYMDPTILTDATLTELISVVRNL
jgi:tRNA (guanine26-N2/guanine27-N2)-dimethyltransferase